MSLLFWNFMKLYVIFFVYRKKIKIRRRNITIGKLLKNSGRVNFSAALKICCPAEMTRSWQTHRATADRSSLLRACAQLIRAKIVARRRPLPREETLFSRVRKRKKTMRRDVEKLRWKTDVRVNFSAVSEYCPVERTRLARTRRTSVFGALALNLFAWKSRRYFTARRRPLSGRERSAGPSISRLDSRLRQRSRATRHWHRKRAEGARGSGGDGSRGKTSTGRVCVP